MTERIVIDSSAPAWAQFLETDLNAVISELLSRIAELEARLKALEEA